MTLVTGTNNFLGLTNIRRISSTGQGAQSQFTDIISNPNGSGKTFAVNFLGIAGTGTDNQKYRIYQSTGSTDYMIMQITITRGIMNPVFTNENPFYLFPNDKLRLYTDAGAFGGATNYWCTYTELS